MTDKPPKKPDNDNEPDKEQKPPIVPVSQDALSQVQALEQDPKILVQRIDSLEKTIQALTNENREEKKKLILEKIKKIRPALAEKHKDASYEDLSTYLEILEEVGPPTDFPVLGLHTKEPDKDKPKLFYNRVTGEYE